jgi:hypothetical protein
MIVSIAQRNGDEAAIAFAGFVAPRHLAEQGPVD